MEQENRCSAQGDNLAIKEIMDGLNCKFMSLGEYKWKCFKGILTEKQILADDQSFYKSNPDNPMASGNRFVRIDASDELLRLVKNNKPHISEEIVDFLNFHLFDCCATVRQTLMLSLVLIENKKSLDYFKMLVYFEESPSTKEMLEYIIDNYETGKNDILGHPDLKLRLT